MGYGKYGGQLPGRPPENEDQACFRAIWAEKQAFLTQEMGIDIFGADSQGLFETAGVGGWRFSTARAAFWGHLPKDDRIFFNNSILLLLER